MSTLHTVASREPAVDAPPADVHAYARAVRRHLGGLSPDQVDDLTDGLEADLADALADQGDAGTDLLTLFGPPQEYAAELRTAAGFGDAPAPRRRRSRALRARLVALRDRALAPLRAQSWWPRAAALATELAPAWWVLRGYVLYRLVVGAFESRTTLLPYAAAGWVLLLAALAVSVQWGRGRWRNRRGLRTLAVAAQVVAVVALVPVVSYLSGSVDSYGGSYTVYESPDQGVYVDGEAATNLFVYDGDGMPVPFAQVYDQDGRPVSVGPEAFEWDDDGRAWWLEPAEDLDGTRRANVYPRSRVADGPDAGEPVAAPLPFAQAPAFRTTPDVRVKEEAGAAAGAEPGATPSSTPAADGEPEPSTVESPAPEMADGGSVTPTGP